MGLGDPFPGYSLLLRVILLGLMPAFALWQWFRLRRALRVFQLEGYKRARFLAWSRANAGRVLFLATSPAKTPLAMTGRAWRLLVTSLLLSVGAVLLAAGGAHVAAGWPYDVAAWAIVTVTAFAATPWTLVAADLLLAPLQRAINERYERAASRKLARVAPFVVGVTGSFGKTSTKFALARLIGDEREVIATPASFNTRLGVVRTINESLEDAHRYLVVEMGAYGRGEIAELCALVRPRMGVLTAVGPAHLSRFGSLDAVRQAKYELIESLPEDGAAVMNSDDLEVRALADETTRVDVVRYGLRPEGRPDVTADGITVSRGGTSLEIVDRRSGERLHASTRLLGSHAIGHVLAGVCAALVVGRRLEDLGDAIASLRAVPHRLEIIEAAGGITVIDDAYNSNPQGAEVALEVLAQMPARRRVVVTPGIVELGELQFEANRRLGQRAAAVADAVVVVAPLNRGALVDGARAQDGDADVVVVDSLPAAQEKLRAMLRPGDVVLFENDLPGHLEG
jgi:UDP-N-acetylmuramoyl-tripeptide--D-alanyl-D-alanine ligase